MEERGRQGRRHKQLMNNHRETRGYCKFKKEAPDHTFWRTDPGGSCRLSSDYRMND
jgi:hypothetical protein